MMGRTSTSCARRFVIALAMPAALISCGDDDNTSDSAAATVGASTTGAAVTSSAAATSLTAESAPTTTSGRGVTYVSSQRDYSALFPAEPSEQTQPTPLPDGSRMDIEIAGLEGDDRFYATARGQFPKGTTLNVPAALRGAQKQAIANVNGTLISSRDIELQGRPGREFSASLSSNGEAGTLLQRVYLDGEVIYQNIVTGAGELTFKDPEAARFFESFRFTGN
jgi:hypothetical protein